MYHQDSFKTIFQINVHLHKYVTTKDVDIVYVGCSSPYHLYIWYLKIHLKIYLKCKQKKKGGEIIVPTEIIFF